MDTRNIVLGVFGTLLVLFVLTGYVSGHLLRPSIVLLVGACFLGWLKQKFDREKALEDQYKQSLQK